MRGIIFRAWDAEEACWVQPGLVSIAGDGGLYSYDTNADCLVSEILPLKISPFTGLHDKNGKEIYEGDILDREGIGKFPVTINETHGYRFMIGLDQICKADAIYGTVIGNIYENPEMMASAAQKPDKSRSAAGK